MILGIVKSYRKNQRFFTILKLKYLVAKTFETFNKNKV